MATLAPPLVVKSTLNPPPVQKSVLYRGLPGPPGPAGGTTFEYPQTVAALVWTVPHNLNRYPSVVVTDGLGELLIADVVYIDSNIVQITHGAARVGIVYCN